MSLIILILSGEITKVTAKEKKGIEIRPSGVQEDCFEMPPDKTLFYSFNATKLLKFDIHYHLKEKTVFPVSGKTSAWKGVFPPHKSQKFYCLQWKNPHSELVNLDYNYSIRNR
jgi:hypothetical protein